MQTRDTFEQKGGRWELVYCTIIVIIINIDTTLLFDVELEEGGEVS